jgi:uncharacterized protein YodC (DUF2158 family)
MTVFKSGDLVVLRSGGPVMTIDTVNTDIFDDDKITGLLCAWFEGDKLQRVRFDHRAVEPVQTTAVVSADAPSPETSVEYKAVLDDMVDAMNVPAEAAKPDSSARPPRPKRARTNKRSDAVRAPGVPVN